MSPAHARTAARSTLPTGDFLPRVDLSEVEVEVDVLDLAGDEVLAVPPLPVARER